MSDRILRYELKFLLPRGNAPLDFDTAVAGLPPGAAWVKRDERSAPMYGGNKPRKLEFLIGNAIARRARRLVTTGRLATNHGLATTIAGRAAGLATTLVLVDQPLPGGVRESLLLQSAWEAGP